MPSVHDLPVCRKDDGIRQIRFVDELRVFCDAPPRQMGVVTFAALIEFSNVFQLNALSRQMAGEFA
jgi:hypothetical protein